MPSFLSRGRHLISDDANPFLELNFALSTQAKQALKGFFTCRIIVRYGDSILCIMKTHRLRPASNLQSWAYNASAKLIVSPSRPPFHHKDRYIMPMIYEA
ncbi:hypothetical protein TNCV_148811 [Trichonephila clavipes]|nr:hypothetical protein TNCV_148811 [Trichonephila clavipes]